MESQTFLLAAALFAGLLAWGVGAYAAGPSSSQASPGPGSLVVASPSDAAPSIDAQELKKVMRSANPPVVIDVRQPEERENGAIEGDKNIPLGELDKHYSELPKDKTIVFYCRSGRRSANAATMLMEKGYSNVKSLTGGINAWSGGERNTRSY